MKITRKMIFMCVTKVSNRHFWTEMMAYRSDNNHPLKARSKEIVVLYEEDSQNPYLEMTAEATGVSRATVARIPREKSEIL